jgi:hypothetical protein
MLTPTVGRRLFGAAYLLLALCALGAALVTVHIASLPGPFWDEWQYVNPSEILSHFFKPHNEHPLELGKFLLILDYNLFNGLGFLPRTVMWLEFAGACWAVVELARRAGLKERLSLCIIGSVTVCTIFSAFGWENLRWAFQVAYVAGFAGPTIAIGAVARYADKPSRGLLILAHIALLAGMFGLASGLFGPFVVAGMALALGLGRRTAGEFLITAVIGWGPYLIFRQPGQAHLSDALYHLDDLLLYGLRYLGGLYGMAFNYWNYFGVKAPSGLSLAAACGAVLLFANVVFTTWLSAKRQLSTGVIGLIALSVVCLLSAALTAVGRAQFGADQALSSRYAVGGALFLSTTLGLGFAVFHPAPLRWRWNAVLSTAGCLLLVAFIIPDIPAIKNLQGRRAEEFSGMTALITGVRDEASINKVTFDIPGAIARAPEFRAAGKYEFADKWTGLMGSNFAPRTQANCPSRIPDSDLITPLGMRVAGDVPWPGNGAREVIMVDGTGKMVGYGQLPPHPSDFYPFARPHKPARWAGHLALPSLRGIKGYLVAGNGDACRIW